MVVVALSLSTSVDVVRVVGWWSLFLSPSVVEVKVAEQWYFALSLSLSLSLLLSVR